jgi:hypothetical protein
MTVAEFVTYRSDLNTRQRDTSYVLLAGCL